MNISNIIYHIFAYILMHTYISESFEKLQQYFGKLRLCTYVNFTNYYLPYAKWMKIALKLLSNPDGLSLFPSSNSQPNWILNRNQLHYLLRVRKLPLVIGDLQLSCLITFDDINTYLRTCSNYSFKNFGNTRHTVDGAVLYLIINNC